MKAIVVRRERASKALELVPIARSLVGRMRWAVESRSEKPWLAGIGIPLAMIAAFLSQPLLTLPLVLAAWWWSPRAWGWEWVNACGRGLVGVEWALIGANALQAWPDQRLVVGLLWASAALLLASAGVIVDLAKRLTA